MKVVVLILLLALAPLASAADPGNAGGGTNPDPLIKINRVTNKFNDFLDKILLRPVAKAYVTVVPSFVRARVTHFFGNLADVNSSLNSFLQGKPKDGFRDLGRIVMNTTVGIGGLFDPAGAVGLADHDEDFGQTLAVWGVPRGPYLVLPLLGPSTLEDAIGSPLNSLVDPLRWLYPVPQRNGLYLLHAVDERASLLPMESAVFGDKYIFYRDAYLQRRNYLIHDGKVKDTFDNF